MSHPEPAPAGLLPMADSHNDLLLGVLHQRERGHADPFGDVWLPQLRAGGVVLQVLPVFTEEQHVGEGALRRALLVIETAQELAALHRDDVAIVETAQELRDVLASGRIALILAFEGMEPVGRDVALLDTFFRLGVRMASFTWNRRTAFADGAGENATGGRLTQQGIEALARMERIGMILDVSHLSDRGLWHVAELATKPFVASHSSCRALRDHPRNLPDDGLRAIARSGGFIGMNAFGGFLADERATVDDFIRHIRHAVDVVGADHVGLGMDFVQDLFEMMDPVLGGVLLPTDLPTVAELQRPADLAGLGTRLTQALGQDVARAVGGQTMIDRLADPAAQGSRQVSTTVVDAVVIGAGMAGLSAGAELARDRSVAVLERESSPAFHTTGRSAAVYIERYGGPAIAPFNLASYPWFTSAAEGAVDHPLLTMRGMLVLAAPGSVPDLEHYAEPGARDLSPVEALELFPAIRPEAVGSAVYVPQAADLDAAGAVAAYRRLLRERGGSLVPNAEVTGLVRRDGAWEVTSAAGSFRAGVVVDAAGSWADGIAAMAGLPPVGLRPLRRTIATFTVPDSLGHTRWPMLVDADERFYLKPEPGHFLASPADETPSEPCDPRPDMLDIATALERVHEATTLTARSVAASWAGLRTFAPDRRLVLGPDPLEPSFVWCAGQGGFGIQASPAAARAIVSLVDHGELPEDIVALGGDAVAVTVGRFRA